MKVKYEFEIDKKEYHKVLCEGCPMLHWRTDYCVCKLNDESASHRYDQNETHMLGAMSYLESKCPLEVVK